MRATSGFFEGLLSELDLVVCSRRIKKVMSNVIVGEDEEDEEGAPPEEEDDDNNDDDNHNDDDGDESDFSDTGSGSSYDTASTFALNLSSSSSPSRTGRPRRVRRRHLRGGGYDRTDSDDDDGWSTITSGGSFS